MVSADHPSTTEDDEDQAKENEKLADGKLPIIESGTINTGMIGRDSCDTMRECRRCYGRRAKNQAYRTRGARKAQLEPGFFSWVSSSNEVVVLARLVMSSSDVVNTIGLAPMPSLLEVDQVGR